MTHRDGREETVELDALVDGAPGRQHALVRERLKGADIARVTYLRPET